MGELAEKLRIPERELLDLMADFGAIGAAAGGGVTRLAASAEDGRARDRLCAWIEENGGSVLYDRIGSIFGIFNLGAEFGERSLFCGSHLDSQPNGGRFDGIYGVLAAALAIREIARRVKAGALRPHYRLLVISNWTNEEGARFQPSLLGSSAFCGLLGYDQALAAQDQDGIALASALQEIGYSGSQEGIPRPDRYVEIHVEQGRILEDDSKQIGLVTHCWGARKLRVVFKGEAAHTGPTPMAERKDALVAASLLIAAINEHAGRSQPTLHGSVGRMEIVPNSPNVVPEQTKLWVELRSGDEASLTHAEAWLTDLLAEIEARTGCRGQVIAREGRAVQAFDADGIALAEMALDRARLSHQRLATIAGHDAVTLQKLCPSTLLFVPSVKGIAHSPDERTHDQDLINGLTALISVLEGLIGCAPTEAAG